MPQPPRSYAPMPPPGGERVLSRHASPARGSCSGAGTGLGALMASRDSSPARYAPRHSMSNAPSRDASPGVSRPLAPSQIVAAAVAEIAQSQSSHRNQVGLCRTATPPGLAKPPSASSSLPPQDLTSLSPERSASSIRGPRAGGSSLRPSRDTSPARALAFTDDNGPDAKEIAEMLSSSVAWRMPMRMGYASLGPAARAALPGGQGTGGTGGPQGRTSRDSSPHSRGMHGLSDKPPLLPLPSSQQQQQQQVARPPKPLTKPANWGRGGDPGRGNPTAGSSSNTGLGTTLPSLVQSHVFITPGSDFTFVHHEHSK